MYQGKTGAGLHKALRILTIQLGLEDHLTQRWLQLNLLNLADVDTAIADWAANPQTRIVVGHQGEGAHFRPCLLFAIKQLMAAAAGSQPVKLDGTAQQGRKIAHLDVYAIDAHPGIQGRFFPELRLPGEQGGINAVNLQLDLHPFFGCAQLLDLARLKSQIEHG